MRKNVSGGGAEDFALLPGHGAQAGLGLSAAHRGLLGGADRIEQSGEPALAKRGSKRGATGTGTPLAIFFKVFFGVCVCVFCCLKGKLRGPPPFGRKGVSKRRQGYVCWRPDLLRVSGTLRFGVAETSAVGLIVARFWWTSWSLCCLRCSSPSMH